MHQVHHSTTGGFRAPWHPTPLSPPSWEGRKAGWTECSTVWESSPGSRPTHSSISVSSPNDSHLQPSQDWAVSETGPSPSQLGCRSEQAWARDQDRAVSRPCPSPRLIHSQSWLGCSSAHHIPGGVSSCQRVDLQAPVPHWGWRNRAAGLSNILSHLGWSAHYWMPSVVLRHF